MKTFAVRLQVHGPFAAAWQTRKAATRFRPATATATASCVNATTRVDDVSKALAIALCTADPARAGTPRGTVPTQIASAVTGNDHDPLPFDALFRANSMHFFRLDRDGPQRSRAMGALAQVPAWFGG